MSRTCRPRASQRQEAASVACSLCSLSVAARTRSASGEEPSKNVRRLGSCVPWKAQEGPRDHTHTHTFSMVTLTFPQMSPSPLPPFPPTTMLKRRGSRGPRLAVQHCGRGEGGGALGMPEGPLWLNAVHATVPEKVVGFVVSPAVAAVGRPPALFPRPAHPLSASASSGATKMRFCKKCIAGGS